MRLYSFFMIILVSCLFVSFTYADADNNKINIGFFNTSQRFARDETPSVPLTQQWKAKAWKGEKIHQQILIWSDKSLPAIKIKVNDLKNAKGQIINKNQIQTGFVDYVWTDGFGNNERSCKSDRRGILFDSLLVADPIYPKLHSNAQSHKVQPVWLSIEVPATTVSGTYTGTIEIWTSKKTILTITVEVLNKTLPPPSQWSFHLDLWQHPAAIARIEKLPLWSEAHFKAMRPYYTMLAKAGQKIITTSIVNEPWDHQTYDDFPSLIKWTRKKDGNWKYDYSLFDKYVSFVMDCGIDQQINCYSMIPWKLSFKYFDETSGKDTVLNTSPGSAEYNLFWKTMLIDFATHLKNKGWFNKTTIAMDERPMKSMQAAIALLKSLDPSWKISLAGNYHPEMENDIYDYSLASQFQFDAAILKERKEAGKKSTYYTCCAERYPNGFTFSPPDEHVWMGWYAAAKNFDGYLRWAYNSWPESPLRDSRFTMAPAGDCFQVYPHAISSIRFEKLIEGIQDYEKIRILKKEYKKNGDQESLNNLQKVLNEFEISQLENTTASEMMEKVKKLINKE